MSYILFLLYSVIYFAKAGISLCLSLVGKKEDETEKDDKQKDVRLDIILVSIGIILAFWCCFAFLFEGKVGIPPLVDQGFILSYLVIAGITFLASFYFAMKVHRGELDTDSEQDIAECFKSKGEMMITLTWVLGYVFSSLSSFVVIVMMIMRLF